MTQDHPSGERRQPTAAQPLNGPRRGRWRPALYLLVFIAVLAGIYFFGVEVLVPSD